MAFGGVGHDESISAQCFITIVTTQFLGGVWKDWEHTCNEEEADAVVDSARAKADEHSPAGTPDSVDYFPGARSIFDVAYGPPDLD